MVWLFAYNATYRNGDDPRFTFQFLFRGRRSSFSSEKAGSDVGTIGRDPFDVL
jgi:hypothetical protein